MIEGDPIKEYPKKVEDIIRPLIGILYPSINAPEVEICMVASKITTAASDWLPHTGPIKDEVLKSICKKQRKTRKRWSDAEKPIELALYMKKGRLSRDMFTSI